MKYVGLLCMAAAVVAGGFLMAGEWEARVKILLLFRQMMVYLKSRILYSNGTLPEALKEVGTRFADEKSGMEKRTASYMLVQAADFETALKNLVEGMKGTMADWVIVSITETPLMDVYPFDPERKTKEEDRPQE